MFFNFMIFLMILFAALFMIVSLPSIILNITENDKDELGVLSPSFLVYISIGNHGITASDFHNTSSITAIIALNLTGIIIIFSGYRIYRIISLKKASRIDEETITPSDFTVFAMNIKKDATRKEIWDFLEKEHNAKNIVDIIFCYDINTAVKLLRK